MRVVEPAFHALQPVAFLYMPRGEAVILGQFRPFQRGEVGLLFRRPHIGPDHAALLDARTP